MDSTRSAFTVMICWAPNWPPLFEYQATLSSPRDAEITSRSPSWSRSAVRTASGRNADCVMTCGPEKLPLPRLRKNSMRPIRRFSR